MGGGKMLMNEKLNLKKKKAIYFTWIRKAVPVVSQSGHRKPSSYSSPFHSSVGFPSAVPSCQEFLVLWHYWQGRQTMLRCSLISFVYSRLYRTPSNTAATHCICCLCLLLVFSLMFFFFKVELMLPVLLRTLKPISPCVTTKDKFAFRE